MVGLVASGQEGGPPARRTGTRNARRVRNLYAWWFLVHLPWAQLQGPSRSLLDLTRPMTPRHKAQSNYLFTSGGQSPSAFLI
jgi:hypothetical protein